MGRYSILCILLYLPISVFQISILRYTLHQCKAFSTRSFYSSLFKHSSLHTSGSQVHSSQVQSGFEQHISWFLELKCYHTSDKNNCQDLFFFANSFAIHAFAIGLVTFLLAIALTLFHTFAKTFSPAILFSTLINPPPKNAAKRSLFT